MQKITYTPRRGFIYSALVTAISLGAIVLWGVLFNYAMGWLFGLGLVAFNIVAGRSIARFFKQPGEQMGNAVSIEVVLQMTEDDFRHLCAVPGVPWDDSDVEDWFTGRYEYQYSKREIAEDREGDGEPRWDWKLAYWVSDSRADLILVTSYLRAKNKTYEILWDMQALSATGTQCAYVVLTDYETS